MLMFTSVSKKDVLVPALLLKKSLDTVCKVIPEATRSPAVASSVTPEGIITLLALAPDVGALIVWTIISLAISDHRKCAVDSQACVQCYRPSHEGVLVGGYRDRAVHTVGVDADRTVIKDKAA